MQPKLSIIITCYNLGLYLEEALASVLNYSSKEQIEIIVVNDGSTDDLTINALKRIEQKFPEIYILNQDNQGLAKARNNGIAMSNGKYIIPLDADNKLRHAFISQSISLFDLDASIDVIYGDAQFFGNKNSIWRNKKLDITEMLLSNHIDACAAFRKSTWDKVGRYDESMPIMGFEDWDLWLRMLVQGCGFFYSEEVYFDYRVRDNSMLSDAWQKRDELLDYIFDKKELKHLMPFRECVLENRALKKEPTYTYALSIIGKKIKRKMRF
ncbi:glycosyltransferase family 2 protein [Mariniflexile sp.]|uniref:glycosyltransferase family 2 protein n=1 Tax=Mariniflexile sp. TaxID=1979402 RepID=UPI0035659267